MISKVFVAIAMLASAGLVQAQKQLAGAILKDHAEIRQQLRNLAVAEGLQLPDRIELKLLGEILEQLRGEVIRP